MTLEGVSTTFAFVVEAPRGDAPAVAPEDGVPEAEERFAEPGSTVPALPDAAAPVGVVVDVPRPATVTAGTSTMLTGVVAPGVVDPGVADPGVVAPGVLAPGVGVPAPDACDPGPPDEATVVPEPPEVPAATLVVVEAGLVVVVVEDDVVVATISDVVVAFGSGMTRGASVVTVGGVVT